jgi:hypothetical protein
MPSSLYLAFAVRRTKSACGASSGLNVPPQLWQTTEPDTFSVPFLPETTATGLIAV